MIAKYWKHAQSWESGEIHDSLARHGVLHSHKKEWHALWTVGEWFSGYILSWLLH